MNRIKILLISFCIAVLYLIFSLLYYLYRPFGLTIEGNFFELIEAIIILPSFTIFGIGYFEGDNATLLTGLIVFLIIWMMTLPFILTFSSIIKYRKTISKDQNNGL